MREEGTCFHSIMDAETKTPFVTRPKSHRYQEAEKGFWSPKSGGLFSLCMCNKPGLSSLNKPGFSTSVYPSPSICLLTLFTEKLQRE